ncbi:helix-turn-helix domain-containing protein [Halonotius roseus]|uniref:Response regulator n=1 Tax=Halonotius roseus TaxID=2511997 RepID=A0A544QL41_9EURY|nr:helix-turn-helix domain-containing protein [Halonotius roseus]TQQ79063.1 response regulator [Halonotius roseus]
MESRAEMIGNRAQSNTAARDPNHRMGITTPSHAGRDPLSTPAQLLLIDDDEQWLTLARELLVETAPDFDVVTATSLSTGRQQFTETAFDCVVCDYRLGDGTGLELLSEVRDSHPELPFVLVTSRGDESVAADAISQGVTDYIPKELIREDFDDPEEPILAAQLRKVVRSYRSRRALQQERELKTTAVDLLTTMSNQQELYRRFCALLQDNYGYSGVWIGTVGAGGRIIPRAISGCETYVQALDCSGDGGDRFDPAIRALDTEDVAVAAVDDGTEPWADQWAAATTGFDFEAGIGVPIGDDRVQFGVLGAYTAETPITDEGIDLLREFARLISYTIRTDEWTESLIADEPVILEIEIDAPTEPLLAFASQLPADADCTIHSVAEHKDGQLLYSVDITGTVPDNCREYVADSDYIELYDTTETADGHECRLLVTPPTPESIAREYGMQFETITIDDGLRTITGYLSTDSAVPNLLADLRSTFEHTTLTSVTTAMTTHREHTTTTAQLLDPLTTRQREILSQAYYDGYFEEPRETNATELADRFGIARATFTQHLRSAQRKLFATIFSQEGHQ